MENRYFLSDILYLNYKQKTKKYDIAPPPPPKRGRNNFFWGGGGDSSDLSFLEFKRRSPQNFVNAHQLPIIKFFLALFSRAIINKESIVVVEILTYPFQMQNAL
uniref:Uncharacterized protein n=1 Tax=Cacopsylla melanoneura TaxID=428564 RepID=A0A8D9A6N9_9HEMI